MKKEGSHVGMILSFMIFITFIAFLYIIIGPTINIGEDKEAVLEYIEGKIAGNVSSNLTRVGVRIIGVMNPFATCVQLRNFLAFMDIDPPYPLIVKNETGGIQEAYSGSGAEFANLVINRRDRNNLFFEVSFSPAFEGLEVNPYSFCFSSPDYNISIVRTEEYVYEKNVYALIDYYKSNYDALRTAMKIPQGSEFGFDFKQSNGTVVGTGGDGVANVYAKETPIQYFDEKANLHSGFINIRVW